MRMYIGIDLGTSAVKTLLMDAAGTVIASHSAALDIARPATGWSEQNPSDWWDAVDATMLALAAAEPDKMAAVQAIGLAGQMHGLVALGTEDDILRPAILWNDTRCAAEAAEMDRDQPAFRRIGGNAVMPGFTAPKAVWMARHEPEVFAQIETILLPKDYLRFRLTGAKYADMSDAAGTLWLDVAARQWSPELVAACGLTMAQMPKLVEGSAATAPLHPDLSRRWGIDHAPIVAGGAGDNAAAAIGLGVIAPGDGFLSLGTSGVVFMVTDQFAPAADSGAHAFCHAIPERWHQMGVILAASDAVSWLSEITNRPVDELMAAVDHTDLLATMPLFHPYLSGERTPHNDAMARAGFFGLTRGHDHGDMARAVLQGVAYAIGDAVDVLRAAGAAPTRLLATGGGAVNMVWLRMIASVTGCEIAVPGGSDTGAALGAARLALLADGGDIQTVCCQPAITDVILPDPEWVPILARARHHSQSLYQAVKGITD